MMMHGSAGTSMVQGLGNERNRFFEDLQRKTKSIELKLTSLVQEYDKSSHPPPRVFLAKVEELMGEYSRLLEEMNREEVSSFLRLALYQNRPDENPLYVPDRLYTGLHKDLETHEQQVLASASSSSSLAADVVAYNQKCDDVVSTLKVLHSDFDEHLKKAREKQLQQSEPHTSFQRHDWTTLLN